MPFSLKHVPFVGIDFGTTNSSIALATPEGRVELASFPAAMAATESFRSVLYLEQLKQAGRNHIKSFTGPTGIEHYLYAEHKGRLIQSLKSYLTSRTLTGTEVFGRHYSIEDLISRILTDLRLSAEQQFGQPILHATVGRPV
ncbi:MAG: Hsp70 family protein, partial [Edaphobacter sp.]